MTSTDLFQATLDAMRFARMMLPILTIVTPAMLVFHYSYKNHGRWPWQKLPEPPDGEPAVKIDDSERWLVLLLCAFVLIVGPLVYVISGIGGA